MSNIDVSCLHRLLQFHERCSSSPREIQSSADRACGFGASTSRFFWRVSTVPSSCCICTTQRSWRCIFTTPDPYDTSPPPQYAIQVKLLRECRAMSPSQDRSILIWFVTLSVFMISVLLYPILFSHADPLLLWAASEPSPGLLETRGGNSLHLVYFGDVLSPIGVSCL